MNLKENNLMFMEDPMKEMKYFSDEEVLQEMKNALSLGWDLKENYGHEYNHYNALHSCAVNFHFKSCEWLLEKGINPNIHSGNDNTAFTFIISQINNSGIETKEFINFFEILKKYGADLSLYGYDKLAPLCLYDRYNGELNEEITEYLIKHADFENSFLLNEILTSRNLLNIKNLKTIFKYHKINLKKVIPVNENNINPQTYWDTIAFSLNGRYFKPRYDIVTWLHNKLGFDLEYRHNYHDYDGVNNYKYNVNLLGLAIQNKNNNMFQWILKRKPEDLNDKFYRNDKSYSLLEFSLLCEFRKGVQIALKNMSPEELMLLNVPQLKKLCSEHDYPLTLETFQKTYTALMYKTMLNKYENNPIETKKKKKIKI